MNIVCSPSMIVSHSASSSNPPVPFVAKNPCIVRTSSGPKNSHPIKEFGKNPFTLNLASNSPNELHTGETSPTGTPKAEERDDDRYTKEN